MENGSNVTQRLMASSDLLFDMNSAEQQRLIPTAIFLGLIAGLGLLGNALVIHIYRTKYKLSNAKIFIISVSAIDMFSCCIGIPFEITLLMEQYTFEHVLLCKGSRFFNTFGTCTSSFILFFIAVDRFRKVCKPLKKQITPRMAKLLCILSAVFGVVVALPAIFVYGKKTFKVTQDILDETVFGSECSTADGMVESSVPFINTAMFSVLFIAGIVTMSVLYCLIGCKIRKQSKKMRLMTARSMSIPMTSSICVENGAVIAGQIDPGRNSHEDVIAKKNNEMKKQNRSRRHNSEKSTDNSWARDGEVSYTSSEKEEHVDVNRSKKDEIDKETYAKERDGVEDVCVTSKDTNYNYEKSECVHTSEGTETLKNRVYSMGSQISHVIRRMTSFGSHTSDETSDTSRKVQCLKEARARRTAFIMFLISLAYILSYLPHLILMATRVVKDEFVDELSDEGRAVYKFFLRSYFLNCAINPIIYGLCDTRFRHFCSDFFSQCCLRK